MKDFILEIINTYGMEILGTALVALAGSLGLAFKKLAARYFNTKEVQKVAHIVVQGVEQVYKALSGPEKLEKAMEAAAEMLAARGITVTELELRMQLEAAVGEFNNVFTPSLILEGIDVDDLDDDQLREIAGQAGLSRSYVDSLTREQLLDELDKLAE